MTTEATDIRFAVDTEEVPLCYPEGCRPAAERIVVEIAGPHLLVTLVLPTETAREWAGELFAGVSLAYREATGDPHAMSDEELAGFTRAGYDPPLASTSAVRSAHRHGCALRSPSTSSASRSAPVT